jgi:hypothetical protein
MVVAVVEQGAVAGGGVEVIVGTDAGRERPAALRNRRVQPDLGAEAVAVVQLRMAFVQVVGADRQVFVDVLVVAERDRERGVVRVLVDTHGAGQQGGILGLGQT